MFEYRRIIKDIWEQYEIDISYFVALGLLHIDDAKNCLVRQEYKRLLETREYTCKEIKERLSGRYSVSISSTEKMIYNNH